MTKKSLHRKSGKFQKNPRISVKNKRPKIREILTYFVYAKGKCTIEFLFVFQPRIGRKSYCERTRFLYAVTCKGRDFTDFSLRDITRYSLWLLHPFVFLYKGDTYIPDKLCFNLLDRILRHFIWSWNLVRQLLFSYLRSYQGLGNLADTFALGLPTLVSAFEGSRTFRTWKAKIENYLMFLNSKLFQETRD